MESNLVECGCVNAMACNECHGTGFVRVKKIELTESQIDGLGVVNLAENSTKPGAYF